MAATELVRPFHRPGWVYEEKVDGYKDGTGVRLLSRNGRELTRRFRDVAAAVAQLEVPTVILDGEIAVFDRRPLSRFEWLRGRPTDEAATHRSSSPSTASTCAGRTSGFGRSARAGTCSCSSSRATASCYRRGGWPRTASGRGRKCSSAATRAWWLTKDPESPYVGGRTLSWLKVKQARYREGERGWEPKS